MGHTANFWNGVGTYGAIAYNLFFNPPKFAEVSAILEPANSTRTDYYNYTRPKKHFKNEQRSNDAAAKKRPNTSGVYRENY